jgi:hypothetical protein
MKADSTVWKWGFWIAAIRLLALWATVIGFRYSDWRQVAGYFLSFLYLPEAFVLRALRNNTSTWAVYMSVLIFFASFLYSAILIRLFRKTSRR